MFNNVTIGHQRKNESKTTLNSAGGRVYKLEPDQELFRLMLDFRPKNSFYLSVPEKLSLLENLIDKCDTPFVTAVSMFAGKELGIRLSPTIAATRLAYCGNYELLNSVAKEIITRPDFIANSIGYYFKLRGGAVPIWKSGWAQQNLPIQFCKPLKQSLEGMKAHTLKKQRMDRRTIKLKNLIMGLRPKPANEEMSSLYKSIIEDTTACKLQVVKDEKTGKVTSADHLTAVMSDKSVSKEMTIEYLLENLKTIPINTLIRNISLLNHCTIHPSYIKILSDRLHSICKSGEAMRFINPFDLLINSEINPIITQIFDEILETYFSINLECKKPLILVDISGSMGNGWNSSDINGGISKASKYLALLKSCIPNANVIPFGSDMMNWDGAISISTDVGPNKFFRDFNNWANPQCVNSTAILRSMEQALNKYTETDGLIVLTDEESWDDDRTVSSYGNLLERYNLSGRCMMINVSPSTGSVFKPDASIVRIAGLDGKILAMTKALFNWEQFKAELIAKYN